MKYTTEGTLTGTDQTVEPVSRSEAKAWLRIDSGTADDALIDALIVSSRQQAEKYTGRAFIERNFSLNLDACDVKPGFPIKLTRAPLTGVSAFQYRGSAGTYENWGTST
ncbi:MAG TPA: head-tail connector protein [Alphaproteobacteria bacterium]|nr:head-tail connector protein [Alphaproteobacteria bacterium]